MKSSGKIKIGIVVSSYRNTISQKMAENCVKELEKNGIGISQIDKFTVPGALEIPLICKKLAKKKKYDAIIVFGVVLKGKTYHFEQVSNECARGCMNVSYEHEIPLIFEVLSVYDLKDAHERAYGKSDNRGVEGALSALKMIKILSKI